MRSAFLAHRAALGVVVLVVTAAVMVLLADRVVPLYMSPNLPQRPWPVVEILCILAYAGLFHLACSRVGPFDSHAPRSRQVRLGEAVILLAAAVGLSLFGSWRLQSGQPEPVEWQTIVVNVAIVGGAMLVAAAFLRSETAIAATLSTYFALVLAQTGLDPGYAAALPLGRMTGPGPWFEAWLVVLAISVSGLGIVVRVLRVPIDRR